MKKLLIASIAALSIAMSSGAAHAADNMSQSSVIADNTLEATSKDGFGATSKNAFGA